MMLKVIEITLLALVAQLHAGEVDTLANRAQAGDSLDADLDRATLAKTQAQGSPSSVTHAPGEVNTGGPTPNATLNKELEAKWGPKIDAGPHSCTAADQKSIMQFPSGAADDSWGKIITDCAHEGLNIIMGINQDTVNTCLATQFKNKKLPPMTKKCSTCYSAMTEYDFENCKIPCLFNWCSEGCIKCNHGSNVIGCIGFVDPQPVVCTTQSSAEQLVAYAQTSYVFSFTSFALIGFFMTSGVILSMRRFKRSATPYEEPLYAAFK